MSFSLNVKLIGVLSSIYFAYLMLSVDSSRIGYYTDLRQITPFDVNFNCTAHVTESEDCSVGNNCMYPYACNCSQYIHCASRNGPAHLMNCSPSDPPLHFSPAFNFCIYSVDSECVDDPDQCLQDTTTTTTTTTLSTTTVITTVMLTSSSPQPSTTTQFSTTTSNTTNNITETDATDGTTLDDDVTKTSTPSTLTSTLTTTTMQSTMQSTMPSTISSTLPIITTVTPMTSVTTAVSSTPLSTNPTEDTTDSTTCSTTTCGANHLKTNNKLVYICQTVLLLFIITLSLRI